MNNDSTRNAIDTIKADVKDGIDEVKHRVQAGVDRAKEAGHNAAADADKAKRDARHGDTLDDVN
jgi:hypothetical protein